MNGTEQDGKRDLAAEELKAVQEGIHSYGRIQFAIKGWAITVVAAFLGVSANTNKGNWRLLIPCFFALLLFWTLDAIYKTIQHAYISRAKVLEAYMQGDEPGRDLLIPDTERSVEKLINLRTFSLALFEWRVMLLYLAMLTIVAGVGAVLILHRS